MFKLILLSTLLLTAFSSFKFNLDEFSKIPIQEGDIELLFNLYLEHLAPPHINQSFDRYIHFKAQVLDIIAHNSDPTNTWRKTITKFTGMTMKELTGSAIMESQNCSATNGKSALGLTDIPVFHDWRESGVVTDVKDQGQCGSCWTFSTTGAVEANWAIYKNSKPPMLSEQQLVDCAGAFNNHGCNGGLPSQAFEYIEYAGGIESEESYPYKGVDGQCVFKKRKAAAKVFFGSSNITSGDEQALLEAAYNVGPVSVAFQVTDDFMSYEGGVYVGKTCGNTSATVNHAVLVVGFGTDKDSKLDYWIVKNSWGPSWGEEGYFRIQRGANMCGIAVCASYPHIKDNKMDLEDVTEIAAIEIDGAQF